MIKVAVIVGSLRKGSINKRLANAFELLGKDLFTFDTIALDDVPMFNEDLENLPPASVQALRASIKAADGVLFITPEYNRSIPAVLKNAIDWASRPYGQNSLSKKPAAIAGISGGAVGTAVAQAELRNMLVILNMRLLGQPEVYLGGNAELITANGMVDNDSSAKFLRSFLESFNRWIMLVK